MKTHTHKCGFAPEPPAGSLEALLWPKGKEEPADGAGCGHEFEHGADCLGSSSKHMCPACGRGPWFEKYRNESGTLNPKAKQTS